MPDVESSTKLKPIVISITKFLMFQTKGFIACQVFYYMTDEVKCNLDETSIKT